MGTNFIGMSCLGEQSEVSLGLYVCLCVNVCIGKPQQSKDRQWAKEEQTNNSAEDGFHNRGRNVGRITALSPIITVLTMTAVNVSAV